MSRVCVTGAAGYIATWLVKKLLGRGCVVHATLRDLGDEKKTALLRRMPGAAERLVLFEADMYDAATFEPAIAGCEFVFLIATPLQHDPSSTKGLLSRPKKIQRCQSSLLSTRTTRKRPWTRCASSCSSASDPGQCAVSSTRPPSPPPRRSGRTAAAATRTSSTSPSGKRILRRELPSYVITDWWARERRGPYLSHHVPLTSRLCVIQVALREGAPELQLLSIAGVRGGHLGVRGRRRRHAPAVPVEHHPGDHVAAHRRRALPQRPQVSAGAAGLRAAGAHRRRLRRARLLHGSAVHRRPLPLRRRVPQHEGLHRPLRR
ncbi:uncharacterized protein [Oryza sativa Japonica Group]|uniref:uncharacterized protein isoform X3 n=1 Tax=Oryza sativa subsp. japonica TaxID=39947 RepID=UPI0007755965